MASFIDTLFGGGAEKDAAAKNAQLLQMYGIQGTTALDKGLAAGQDITGQEATTGQGITGGELAAGQNIIGGGRQDVTSGLQSATDIYNQAQPQETAAVQGGIGSLSGLANKYGAGSSLYLDALGVNGPEAAARAQTQFTTSPGYQQGITSGLDAINRRRALSGMAGSGNADVDALTLAQNAQNKEYGGWLANLQGLVNPELSATQSAASYAPQLANIIGSNAAAKAGLVGTATRQNLGLDTQNLGLTTGVAGQNLGLDTGIAGQNLGLTQNDMANRVALLTGQTTGLMSGNNQVAAGQEAGAKNIVGAAGGLGSALLSGGTLGFSGSPLAALGKGLFSGGASA